MAIRFKVFFSFFWPIDHKVDDIGESGMMRNPTDRIKFKEKILYVMSISNICYKSMIV